MASEANTSKDVAKCGKDPIWENDGHEEIQSSLQSMQLEEKGPKGIAGLLALRNKEMMINQGQRISEDDIEQREFVHGNNQSANAVRESVINIQDRGYFQMELGKGFGVTTADSVLGQHGMEIVLLD